MPITGLTEIPADKNKPPAARVTKELYDRLINRFLIYIILNFV